MVLITIEANSQIDQVATYSSSPACFSRSAGKDGWTILFLISMNLIVTYGTKRFQVSPYICTALSMMLDMVNF